MNGEVMYVVMRLQQVEIECVSHPHLPVAVVADKMAGYLPVYRTLEDLRAEYPDADYVCIRGAQMVARQEEL